MNKALPPGNQGNGTFQYPPSGTNLGSPVSPTARTFQGITINANGLVTDAVDQHYLTANQTITLTGVITGSGTTGIATAFASSPTFTGNIGINGAADPKLALDVQSTTNPFAPPRMTTSAEKRHHKPG